MKIFLNGKKEVFALVDEKDYTLVSKYKWNNSIGYARTKIKGKMILMHRFILNPQKEEEIDHINRNKLDNRRSNLRLCSRSQNAAHIISKKKNKFGYRGI